MEISKIGNSDELITVTKERWEREQSEKRDLEINIDQLSQGASFIFRKYSSEYGFGHFDRVNIIETEVVSTDSEIKKLIKENDALRNEIEKKKVENRNLEFELIRTLNDKSAFGWLAMLFTGRASRKQAKKRLEELK